MQACVYDLGLPVGGGRREVFPPPPSERWFRFFILGVGRPVVARYVGGIEANGTGGVGEADIVCGKGFCEGLFQGSGFGVEERPGLGIA